VILGDLTDEKDYHSSHLVNRLVSALAALAREGIGIHILMGNHDYAEGSKPFFSFISELPRCFFYSQQRMVEIGNVRWAFFPHSREPVWADRKYMQEIGIDYVGCHQVFSGAVSESGRELAGVGARALEGVGKVWAGDIHVPQQVGVVEYVGSPYPIHFGDSFEPRVVMLDGGRHWSLYPETIRKLVLRIRDPDEIEEMPEWRAGDQVKVVVSLRRADFSRWDVYRQAIRTICKRNELDLCGIELQERRRERLKLANDTDVPRAPADQFEAYVEAQRVDPSDAEVGRTML
jgi:hypothetical protein